MKKLATKLRLAHKNMIDRCYNEKNISFKHYGGRGIAVCEDWLDKDAGRYNFIEWALHNGFEMHLTLDRIDTNKSYSPKNCKWSTITEQLNNQRRNHRILFNGKTQTLTEWANELGINPNTLQRRIVKYKMELEKAFTPIIRTWKHGTRQGYEFHKCKCDECLEANNKRHRDIRRAKKMATKNDITGDALVSKKSNENFNKGFDGIDFSKKLVLCDICGKDVDAVAQCDATQCPKYWNEKRADEIGHNGNIGYEPD